MLLNLQMVPCIVRLILPKEILSQQSDFALEDNLQDFGISYLNLGVSLFSWRLWDMQLSVLTQKGWQVKAIKQAVCDGASTKTLGTKALRELLGWQYSVSIDTNRCQESNLSMTPQGKGRQKFSLWYLCQTLP